ncbi:MAG: ATP-binding protein [Thermodesulfobacteriota bacterium]|nr:ATP-binding protein [Thermodesulfobacteriota bacterium]
MHRIQTMLIETSFQPDISYIIITSKDGKILAHSNASMVGKSFDVMPDISILEEEISSVAHRIRQHNKIPVFEIFKRFTPLRSKFQGRHGRSGHPMHGMGMHAKSSRERCLWHGPDLGKTSNESRQPIPDPDLYKNRSNHLNSNDFLNSLWPVQKPCSGHADSQDGSNAGNLAKNFSGMAEYYIFAGFSMTRANLAQKRLLRKTIARGLLFFFLGCAGMISLSAFQAYRSAKANLTSVKAFSDNVIQNMPAGLVTIDTNQKITSMNRTAMDILGKTLTSPITGMIRLVSEMENQKETVAREITLNKGSPGELRLEMTASPIMDNEKQVLGFLFLFRDMTQLRQLKKEIETTRHLAAVGKLAAGVAHEIRNPISSIKGFATYFMKRYEDNNDDRKTAQIMVQEVERINRSITQLLEFAKPMTVENKNVRIEFLISHSLKLVQHDLDQKSITATVKLNRDQIFFKTDPDRINQILLNLYINAIHAMKQGGELVIDVSDAHGEKGLEIRVSDNGCGIDKQHLDDIFDPYFTTRPDGTGLGLSIVHRIVENLKGEIRVESEKGLGTTFIIRLPGSKTTKT